MSAPPASPVTVTRIPDPGEPISVVAWPTLALLVSAITLLAGSSALAVAELWPWWLSVLPNAVAIYLLFSVAHDASHHAVSSNDAINRTVGRISTFLFAPQASFAVWRFIHMQHHRFTNHQDGTDPDAYTMQGPGWQRPLRWVTLDLRYVSFFLSRWNQRPAKDRAAYVAQIIFAAALIGGIVAAGYGLEFLALYALPQRFAFIWLAFAFDYLPHHGLHHTPTQDRLKATRNRIGGERWMTPLLVYQNYHLIHHLHPVVPFYRYIAVWRRNEDSYLQGDPALSTPRGRPITADEYRALRELATHEH